MKQFVYLYPIPEYFDIELRNGSFGWGPASWEKKWMGVLNKATSEGERSKLMNEASNERKLLFSPVYSKILNKCISQRYRDKGFGINYAIFDGHNISEIVDIQSRDRVLTVGMDFRTHTTEVDGEYSYPDSNFLLDQLEDVSELRLAGFHFGDCVQRVARAAYDRGLNVLVDEDLTERLPFVMKQPEFKTDKYPTYDPFKFDVPGDDHLSRDILDARKNKPWLWQYSK